MNANKELMSLSLGEQALTLQAAHVNKDDTQRMDPMPLSRH